ncbi:MurR/RpiR family transcriptional regulator [Kitasatospora saccharophila]|uniref:MurR/RpiR family transcriptional regulator n=1 Tax=Kitasatospora saccharophila TaxID=407973 RepID=UPI00362B944C
MEQNSGTGGLAARIRARLPELPETEARVAQVVLDQGAALVRLSVSDVAALAGTAASTVVRACKRLGFRGFQELKIEAARQAEKPPPPTTDDPVANVLGQVLHASREALDGIATTLDTAALAAAAAALDAAPQTVVAAAGLSGAVALDAAYRLRALGCPVDAPADPLTAQLAAARLPPAASASPSATPEPPAAPSTPPAAPARPAPASSPSPATPAHR